MKSNLPELTEELDQSNERKIFFEFIHLGAIKIKVTLRFEENSISISSKRLFNGFLNMMITGLATISDSPLSLKEVIIINAFAK